jgi:hypothetical protein
MMARQKMNCSRMRVAFMRRRAFRMVVSATVLLFTVSLAFADCSGDAIQDCSDAVQQAKDEAFQNPSNAVGAAARATRDCSSCAVTDYANKLMNVLPTPVPSQKAH